MTNWFKKENYKEYRDRLLNAFPLTLHDDVTAVLDILPFDINDVRLSGGQVHKVDNLIHPNNLTVQLDAKPLTIPCRLYFNEPDKAKENNLTDTQKTILNCIYLRHHDGYLRQRRLELLADKNEYWVTPFTLQLLGEYVFEILVVLDKYLTDKHLVNYDRFINENPKYWQQTESRMISYWNEYYRRQFPKLKDYLGRQLADRIKKSERITRGLR
jgi:hypothetical protein